MKSINAKKIKFLIILLIIPILSSCSGTGSKNRPTISTTGTGSTTIYFTREGGFVASGVLAKIEVNGSEIAQGGEIDFRSSPGRKYVGNISGVFDLSVSDYIEIYAKLDTVSSDVKFASSASRPTKFYGYKLL